VIAANKADLTAAIEINEIDKWSMEEHLEVVYLSAKRGDNVNLFFDLVIEHLPEAAFRLRLPDVEFGNANRGSMSGS
jgi:50S ribosomal subunit-associated GTPase HflX